MTWWCISVVCRGSTPRPLRNDYPSTTPPEISLGEALSTCWGAWHEAYSYPTTTCGEITSRSGTDSDLEAFSHNPADGSVAAMSCQTAAKTNYLNQRFLSY
jgi:hypothetical protein